MTAAPGDGGSGGAARDACDGAPLDAPVPCAVVAGRLHVDGLDLTDLADGLEGRAVWLLSHRAITDAIAACDGPRTVDVARVGPPPVLGLFAAAGWWARCRSPLELEVARLAGFAPERLVVSGRVKDDGFVKDALTLGVGVLEPSDADETTNIERLAGFLDLEVPAATGAPEGVAACALDGCGGLVAPVLRAPPAVALDAPWCAAWTAAAATRVGAATDAGARAATSEGACPADDHSGPDALAVWPLAPGAAADGTLEGLASAVAAPPRPARVHGAPPRGSWAFVPSLLAFGRPFDDPAWPVPETVLVRDGTWRFLEPRATPEG